MQWPGFLPRHPFPPGSSFQGVFCHFFVRKFHQRHKLRLLQMISCWGGGLSTRVFLICATY